MIAICYNASEWVSDSVSDRLALREALASKNRSVMSMLPKHCHSFCVFNILARAVFSCGATLYTPLCVCLFVCLSVCLSVPRFVCGQNMHLAPQLLLDIRACLLHHKLKQVWVLQCSAWKRTAQVSPQKIKHSKKFKQNTATREGRGGRPKFPSPRKI